MCMLSYCNKHGDEQQNLSAGCYQSAQSIAHQIGAPNRCQQVRTREQQNQGALERYGMRQMGALRLQAGRHRIASMGLSRP